MIKFSKLDPLNEVVYPRINKREEYQCIAVTRLFNYCERTNMRIHQVAVEQSKAYGFKQFRNIEGSRLLRIKIEYLRIPTLMIQDQGENDMIDGHHRYILAFLCGRLFLPCYIAPPVVWKQYLVRDVPKKTAEQILATGSGIH